MIDINARIAEDDAALAAARAEDEHAAAEAKFAPPAGAAPKDLGLLAKADEFNADVDRWTQRLPRNIGLGLLDAAVNTWDTMKEIGVAAGKGAEMRDAMDSGAAPVAPTAAQNRDTSAGIDKSMEDGETTAAIRAFRNHAAQGDTLSDQLTQGTAQFAIPFMGFSKALGGFKAVSKAAQVARAVGAEAVTSAAAFDPHAGRLADLYALGQHTEGKLADVLNTLAPDGSALNEYINYMSDRDNEGVAEGRFKNVVDNLTGSAAVAGLLKTGAKAFRGARALPEYLNKFNPDAPLALVSASEDIAARVLNTAGGDQQKAIEELTRRGMDAERQGDKAASSNLTEAVAHVKSGKPLRSIEAPAAAAVTAEEAYVPATAQEMHATARNALLDLQDVVDPTNLTPKQQAAYAGLQQSVKQGVDQGWPVSQIVNKARLEAQKFLPTGTPQSLPFRKLVDDLVTHGEQGVSQSKPIAPVRVEETPDGHTVIVGDQPLVTFAKPEDAAAAIADMQQHFGAGFEARHEATRADLTDSHFDTLHTFSRMLERAVDKPIQTHSLVTALESQLKGDTEKGAFYKELLGRIAKKRIGGTTTVKSTPGRSENSAGFFRHADNGTELYSKAFKNPELLLHTFVHETVHAATVRELAESPAIYRKLTSLFQDVVDARLAKEAEADVIQGNGWERVSTSTPGGSKPYGMTNPLEFVAEIEANPEFRADMKKVKVGEKSAWEKYREVIGGILGLSSAMIAAPEFEKLLNPKQEKQPSA